MADVVYYENPFNLREPTATHKVDGCPTVAEWLVSSGYDIKIRQQPIVLVLNAEELLEEDFGRRLGEKDLLVLTAIPEAQVIPYVVAFVKTYWAYIAVAVVLVGAALVLPGMLEPSLQEGIEQDSPNHSLANRGNRARMGNPKPVLYGKARIYPDLSSQAFSEFDTEGNQIVSMLYELSQGSVTIESGSMRFEDTLLSSFQDAETETVEPGSTSTLFPSEVNVSSEVSNIEVEGTTIGPFAVNPTATTISRIGIDLIAPGGIFYQSSSGKQQRWSVVLKFESRLIDNAGSPLGSWTELGRPYLTGFDRKAIRQTFTYTVTPGRYEVRLSRIEAPSSSAKVVDDISWSQLKGYYRDSLPTTNTTRVAVRIRASDQLGNRALTKFNLVATRKLPIWNGSTWSALTATTNPAWAFADACRAAYGGSRADAYMDLAGLLALSSTFTTAGYECNGIFDTKMSLWDALTRICQTCHCMPIDKGGIYSMVQDKAVSTPVQMFNMRNIVQGSFSIDHAGVLEETADHVIIKFYDKDQDYRLVSVPCVLPSGTDDKPREVTLWGVTKRVQAYEMGMRLAAVNRYRRQIVSFETGLEGRIPQYMDPVIVSHRLLGLEGSDQVSGDILSYNGTNTITVTESLTGLFTTPYVWLHDLEGEPKGPYACTVTADKTIRIDETFDDDGLVFSSSYARPRFAIGESSTFHAKVKVTRVTPTDQHKVRIEGFVDAPEVYTITDGETPPASTALRSLQSLAPTVTKLKAAADGSTPEPDVLLTWVGTNSDSYEVQFSEDGTNWYSMGYVREPRFNDVPTPGFSNVRYYRVAGISVFRGAWATLTVNVSDLLDAHVPSVPSQLTVNSAGKAAEIRVVIPNETTTGAPSEIKIYRATGASALYGSTVNIETIPANYDSDNDRYVGFLVDATVVEGETYTYFALPTNPNGDAADHYPTGSNPGVSVTVIVRFEPSTGYLENFADQSVTRVTADLKELSGSLPELSIVSDATAAGQYALSAGNNSGNDQLYAAIDRRRAMPVVKGDLYKISGWVKRTAGSGTIYLGVCGWKGDVFTGGGAKVNNSGTDSLSAQHWFAAENYNPGDTAWHYVEGYFKLDGVAYDLNAGTLNDPHVLHPDVQYVTPILIGNYNGVAGTTRFQQIELRKVDNHGAQSGYNLKDEIGNLLRGIDVRNDQLVRQALGFINTNADFAFPRFDGGTFVFPAFASYTLRPAAWYQQQSTGGKPTYVDGSNFDEVRFTAGGMYTNAPIPVTPRNKYKLVGLFKAVTGTASVTLYVDEYDSDLPTQALYVGATGGEPGVVTRTRVQTIVTDASVGTSYKRIEGIYTPTSTAKWFSISVIPSSQDVICEWYGVANLATEGATAGTDLKDSTGNVLDDPDVLNAEVIVFDHPKAIVWTSFGTTSTDYSPQSTTQSATVNIRDGLGNTVATRTVTGTVTYSNGQISVTEDTVDGIQVTRTGNNTDTVTVTLTYGGKTSTMVFSTVNTTTGGVGK